jgi:hypothetical protein
LAVVGVQSEHGGAVVTSYFRGYEDAVRAALWELHAEDREFGPDHQRDVSAAMEKFEAGAWLVNVNGFRFEVVEPLLSVEQDVYGCLSGRGCSSVTPEQREVFDTMIAARPTERDPAKQHFHWFLRLDRYAYSSGQVRAFVNETLGVELITEAVVALADNAARHARGCDIDVHLTAFPDRVRVHVDDDGTSAYDDALPGPRLLDPGPDGVRPGGLAFIDAHASRWGVIGNSRGWTVWADFPHCGGDERTNAYRTMARNVPIGAYVYDGTHLLWLKVVGRRTFGGATELDVDGDFEDLKFLFNELVPVYPPIGAR